MSLVNKMLRDLDARRVDAGERAALPAAVTPLAARQEPNRLSPPVLFGALAFATILGAVALYKVQGGLPSPHAVPAVPVAPAAVLAPPAGAAAVVVPAAAQATDPAAAPATVQAVAPAPVAAPAPAPAAALPPVPVAAPAATIEPVSAPQSLRMADALSVMPPPAVETTRKATVAPKASERQPTPVIPPRQSVAAVVSKVPPVGAEGRIDKQERLPSPAERAETEYRRAVQAQRQGNLDQAAAGYREALEDHPEHPAARQALAGLLIEARRFDEAEEVLRKGTELAPVRLASILALARLKVERNQAPAALELLQKNAAAGESSAEYQGFAGALLNRAGRAAEAVERYQAAVRLAPGEARWWAGLGIALDSAGRTVEAREAYQKARALPGLPADLAQHIDQRLR